MGLSLSLSLSLCAFLIISHRFLVLLIQSRFLTLMNRHYFAKLIFEKRNLCLRGGVKKKLVLLGGGGRWGGSRPDHNFRPKKYQFFFWVPFDAETFKTCKYTQKKIYLGVPPLPLCQPGCQPVKG